MNLLDCYQILGLRADAELADIKAAYRRLARKYHPDMNRGDHQAEVAFIRITEAYKVLTQSLASQTSIGTVSDVEAIPNLAPHEHRLKWQCYETLQEHLRQGKFARAIAVTEGLVYRLPRDAEVRQWQGIIYCSWGTQLLQQGKIPQAKAYFRKALQADPHNRSLIQRVEQAMENITVTAV